MISSRNILNRQSNSINKQLQNQQFIKSTINMKKNNVIYWVSTGLFVAFMLTSAIPNILSTDEWKALITHLGYPTYILPLLGVAKILGIIALLVPGFPRIKEWAYAGFTFDLIGAVYSGIAHDGFDPMMLTMVIVFGLLALSYIYYHKKLEVKDAGLSVAQG